jgi:16S rRNA (cytosine967-C5)-methyltransferase
LTDAWKAEGVHFRPCSFDWTAETLLFELLDCPLLTSLRTFQEGWFYVQDPGTLLSVRELDPQPGETILDMCAAPGGKTTYIAQLMGNQGKVLATDLSPSRLDLVRENCTRLGATCVTTEAWSPGLNRSGPLDRILLDVPCSNTGVMRRRVELRWRIRPEELDRLVREQRDILEHASQMIRPGGVIVYSTCSVEPEENSGVVQSFLAAHPTFKLKRDRTLLPFRDGVDGAFAARLLRLS